MHVMTFAAQRKLMANQGKEHGNEVFNGDDYDELDMENTREEAIELSKKDNWSEEEESFDNTFAVMWEKGICKIN